MDLQEKCEAFVREIASECNFDETDQLLDVRKNVFDLLCGIFNEKTGNKTEILQYIAADSAIVEIVDQETGLCFRRELPFRYEETGNGVSLIGEDISGNASQISFLSEAAYEKIKDFTGSGPDTPKCGEHGV